MAKYATWPQTQNLVSARQASPATPCRVLYYSEQCLPDPSSKKSGSLIGQSLCIDLTVLCSTWTRDWGSIRERIVAVSAN
ncbi:hypothetical protein FKM82_027980 [Ascaphus truei]